MGLSRWPARLGSAPAPSRNMCALAAVNGTGNHQDGGEQPDHLPWSATSTFADASDYKATVDFLVRQKALEKKVQDMGFDQFSAREELSSLRAGNWKPLGRDPQPVRGLHPGEDTEGRSQGGSHAPTRRRPTTPPRAGSGRPAAGREKQRLPGQDDRLPDGRLCYQPTEEEILEVFNQVGPYQESSMRTTSPPTST